MARSFRLVQVDVFSDTPLRGNPLAVLSDARGLTRDEMQAVAREMNLSETTFVLPAESDAVDYRVRIFTPGQELPFAGHPTLGTAFALLEEGRFVDRGDSFTLRQQTLAGEQTIDCSRDDRGWALTMTQPTPSFADAPPAEELAAALGVRSDEIVGAARVSVGVAWNVVELASLGIVRGLAPDMGRLTSVEERFGSGTTVFCEGGLDSDCAVRVRSFAPGLGIPEDPVCGSGNGCVGAYRARRDGIASPLVYRAEQGGEVGREGRVEVRVDPESSERGGLRVRVGGRCVSVLEGELRL